MKRNKAKLMFKNYKERQRLIREGLRSFNRGWCNRSLNRYRYVNYRWLGKLHNTLRNLEWLLYE